MNLTPLFWMISLLFVLAGVLLIFGARAKSRLKKQYPPIGQIIDMGGYHLQMHVEGNGSPTVVLEAGAGGIGLSWELVRPVISRVTRVVVYDRAGLGWSDPSPYPRDAIIMATELHTLLINANIPAPYILVGHSLGGPITRQFAAKYPQEVIGLVMVDSAHEEQVKHFPEPLVKMAHSMKSMMDLMKWMGKLGLFALKPDLIPVNDHGKLPKEIVAQMRSVIAASDHHAKTLIAETESIYSATTTPVLSLGDLPLTVIRHGQLDVNAIPPSLDPQVREEYERAWQRLQEEITALSSRGRLIVAEKSGHDIIFDQPEVIVEAILEMLNSTKYQMRVSQPEKALTT